MNKELEALKQIKSHYNDRVCIDILEDFDLIETALKRLEEFEKAFDSLSKEDEKTTKLLSKEIEKNGALEVPYRRYLFIKRIWFIKGGVVMKYDKYMDTECIALCDELNSLKGVKTFESCCGH